MKKIIFWLKVAEKFDAGEEVVERTLSRQTDGVLQRWQAKISLERLLELGIILEAIWESETIEAGSQLVVANLKPGFWWWIRNIDRKMINQAGM